MATEALAMYRAHRDWNPREHRHAVQVLAGIHRDSGRGDEAEVVCREFLANERQRLPEGDPEIASALAMLGDALLRADPPKPAEAEPVLRECLAIREEKLPDHWLRFNAMSLLGGALAGQGAAMIKTDPQQAEQLFAAAEPLLLDAYNQMKDAAETMPDQFRDEQLGEALQYIINLYEAWDAAEPGKGYAEKAAEWRGEMGTSQPTHRMDSQSPVAGD